MDLEKHTHRQVGDILKPKTEEEIQYKLDRLPPEKKFSVILRREVENHFDPMWIVSHETLHKKVKEVIEGLDTKGLDVVVSPAMYDYDPDSSFVSLNVHIRGSFPNDNRSLQVTISKYNEPAISTEI